MNKIIVTGGCGFIGSNLVDELVNLNYDVHILDNLSAINNKFYYNEKAKYYNINIIDKKINKILKNSTCVFHLAAESRIKSCIDNPKKALNTNILGTLNLLNVCKKNNINKFIYSSTSSVYGLNNNLPVNEEANIDCLNQYSTTKYCGEELVKLYNKMYNIDSCIFRYFNVFGERSPTKGQYSPVIGIFLNQFKKRIPLTIVGDGEQRRDFIHVKDVVNANLIAMNFKEKINAEIFNVGSGINYSINEISQLISNNVTYLPSRIGEAKNNLADISKIKKILNWMPKIKLTEWIQSKLY